MQSTVKKSWNRLTDFRSGFLTKFKSIVFRPATILVLICLISHGLLLICDYTYWDGWWLNWFLRNGKLASLRDVFSQTGNPLAGDYQNLYHVFANPNQVAKVVSFLFLCVNAFCCHYILRATGMISDSTTTLITCLFIAYPGFQAIGDMTVIHYVTAHGLFWFAALTAVLYKQKQKYYLRVASLVLFFLSFNNNALLPYYGAFLVFFLVIFEYKRSETFRIKQQASKLLRHTDFIILPILYWLIRSWLTPTHGSYEGYNTPDFKHLLLWAKLKNLFNDAYFSYFTENLDRLLLLDSTVLLLAGLSLRLGYVYLWQKSLPNEGRNFSNLGKYSLVFLWGSFMLLCASIAHMSVRGVGLYVAHGFSSRASILLGLPLAFILFACVKIFLEQILVFSRKFSTFVLWLIIGVFVTENNRSYLEWQASAVKDMAVFQHLATQPNFIKASLIVVDDKFDLQYLDKYMDPSIRIFYFGSIFNDLKRMAIDVEHDNRKYADPKKKVPAADIKQLIDYISKGVLLKIDTIPINGMQVDLKIKRGYKYSIYQMPLDYWKKYYFDKSNLDGFLSGLVSIEISKR